MSKHLLTDRVRLINPSFTLAMATRAAELRAQGAAVIDFGVGEPDFNTPPHIIQAAKQAMDDGFTKYTAAPGFLDLRAAICRKLERENDLHFSPDQILVSNGEKQSLYNACQVLFQEGDQVIVFTPYWVSFPEFVRLSGAEPLFVKTLPHQQFEPDFADLESKIQKSIKGVIINSPSNPTGGVWSTDAIQRLLALAAKYEWTVIADECYERLVYEGSFVSAAAVNDHSAEIVTCMSFSKTYAMTGWRIGYAAGSKVIIDAMTKIQGQSTSCANAIGQRAAIAALEGDQSLLTHMKRQFLERRDLMVQLLNDLPNVTCSLPRGAFYAFPDLSAYLGKTANGRLIDSSTALSDYLLDSVRVVTVPGDGFGAPGYLRFSYATNLETIKTGIQRVRSALAQLH